MTQLIDIFRSIVGSRYVLTHDHATRRFRKGYRYGEGKVLAVVRPGNLSEQWRTLKACVEEGVIVISQAANTGLTGGSTPDGDTYDRPIVIINMLRINRLQLINEGRQVICQPGVTLDQLERQLKQIGREPHSVIGSTCIGASVIGGICNNSGGSLIRRGPAFTQLALFAQVGTDGNLRLINHLGVNIGDSSNEVLSRVDSGDIGEHEIDYSHGLWGSDHEYCDHVKDIEASTPARFNADPRRHYEVSGSAGKLAVFAVRLDTFPADQHTTTFYIGSNDPAELEAARRDILKNSKNVPIAGEYMHRSAYDASRKYGKDLFLFIKMFGAQNVPRAYSSKSWFDSVTEAIGLGGHLSDKILQAITSWLPDHLPRRLNDYRDRYAHHLLLKVASPDAEDTRAILTKTFASTVGSFFECNAKEATAGFLNRFAVGGSIVRYRAVNRDTVEDIVALDIALPRNTRDWFESLPDAIDAKIAFKMYCGHFFCHVFHQEYLVKKGEDCLAIEHAMWALLDERGAEYPAEHNVGHLYKAKPALQNFYKSLDPTNTFNPGIGQTSKDRNWS